MVVVNDDADIFPRRPDPFCGIAKTISKMADYIVATDRVTRCRNVR